MSGPENTFIGSVHRHLPAALYRMKNHNQYNGGIADCWYSGRKGDCWIEYKYITVPKRGDTLIDLIGGKSPLISHLQQEWLTSRCAEGRNVGVLVGCKTGGVWFPGKSWNIVCSTQQFCERICSRTDLALMITQAIS